VAAWRDLALVGTDTRLLIYRFKFALMVVISCAAVWHFCET
jgi:hypothetical protein